MSTFHPCHYARSVKTNLLDDGVGDTLVLPEFDDVKFVSHGKRVNLRAGIKKVNLKSSMRHGDASELLLGNWSGAAPSDSNPSYPRRPHDSQPHLSAVRPATIPLWRESIEIRSQVLSERGGI
jgi:hypothetical protein